MVKSRDVFLVAFNLCVLKLEPYQQPLIYFFMTVLSRFNLNKFKKNFLLILVITALVFSGCSTAQAPDPQLAELSKPVTLNYWRVFDDQASLAPIINAFQNSRKNVKINLRILRPEEYESVLLNAWAEDRGPDIFSIPISWLPRYENKISPMPDKIKQVIGETVDAGGLNERIQFGLKIIPTPTQQEIRQNYIDTVAQNVIRDNKVYGLPLGTDTLGLFYNKTIFNNAGISLPPSTWEQFTTVVKKITVINQKGEILRSAVALGTGTNVTRAFDILSTLMIQNGIQMSVGSNVTFASQGRGESYFPVLETLRFFTDFSNPVKENYTWNSSYPDALQAFAQGQTAMFFGYSYHVRQIKALNPSLNFSIAPFPQIDGTTTPVNYASMFIETVPKKTKNIDAAWDFITFATAEKNVTSYLEYTKKPSVLRNLIPLQLSDETVGPFASQVLVARSWYQGYDFPRAERVFLNMIDNFLKLPAGISNDDILIFFDQVGRQIQQTYISSNEQ